MRVPDPQGRMITDMNVVAREGRIRWMLRRCWRRLRERLAPGSFRRCQFTGESAASWCGR